MKISEFKEHLNELSSMNIKDIHGISIPSHFHITECGLITKNFLDCGGKERTEKHVNFQVWLADDLEHRLEPQKLLRIIWASEYLFKNEDLDIEMEFQSETIGKFGLDFNGFEFVLTAQQTNCLADDHCGIPQTKPRINMADLSINTSHCDPKSGCC